MDKEDWHLLFFLLLSHNTPENLDRTIHIRFWGRNIYFCARCTGTYSGILIILSAWLLGFDFPTWLYLPLFSILPIPATADWITQSCNLRVSRNLIRTSTGCLLGVSQGLLLLMLVNGMFYLLLQALAIIGIYLILIYLIAWKTRFLGSRKLEMLRNRKS